MKDQVVVALVLVICGTVFGLAALWRKKNVELQVVAKQLGVQLRISEPGQRRQLGDAPEHPGLGAGPEAE